MARGQPCDGKRDLGFFMMFMGEWMRRGHLLLFWCSWKMSACWFMERIPPKKQRNSAQSLKDFPKDRLRHESKYKRGNIHDIHPPSGMDYHTRHTPYWCHQLALQGGWRMPAHLPAKAQRSNHLPGPPWSWLLSRALKKSWFTLERTLWTSPKSWFCGFNPQWGLPSQIC